MKLNSPDKRVSSSADADAPPQIALHNHAPPAFNCVVPGIISESFVHEHKPGSRRLQGGIPWVSAEFTALAKVVSLVGERER